MCIIRFYNLKFSIIKKMSSLLFTKIYVKKINPLKFKYMSSINEPNFKSFNKISKKEANLIKIKHNELCAGNIFADKIISKLYECNTDKTGKDQGIPLNMYEHGLQIASRMYNINKNDEENIVCGLLHDIYWNDAPHNHGGVIASILEPYITESNYFILKYHDVFQSHNYIHHFNINEDLRNRFKNYKYYNDAIEWNNNYNKISFDKDYKNQPIEIFIPMIYKLFNTKPWSKINNHPKEYLL